jgi:hypothetical protein
MRDGFYWVRMFDRFADWQVAEQCDGEWRLTGSDRAYGDAQIGEVGPLVEPPGGTYGAALPLGLR